MKEKGIEDAVNAVKAVNTEAGRTIYTLDIYGQIDSGQIQWFENLKTTFPEYINYKGIVDYDKSVDVLKNYFALLFPTRFYTEGIPGTIIDAYAAGVPIISSKWESFEDIVDDGITGIGYDFQNKKQLVELMERIEKEQIDKMKTNCLSKGKSFLPTNVVGILKSRLI